MPYRLRRLQRGWVGEMSTGDLNDHGNRNAYARGCRCDNCRKANTASHRELIRGLAQRPEDIPHGTRGGYVNWSCRCDLCSAAHSEGMREGRASRKARVVDAPHGTASGYSSWGCRCDLCGPAGRADGNRRYARRRAVTP